LDFFRLLLQNLNWRARQIYPHRLGLRSLDYAVILSGEIDMMLDDTSVHLKPGDMIVQLATNHGWVNHGKEPCRILFVLMDSKEP